MYLLQLTRTHKCIRSHTYTHIHTVFFSLVRGTFESILINGCVQVHSMYLYISDFTNVSVSLISDGFVWNKKKRNSRDISGIRIVHGSMHVFIEEPIYTHHAGLTIFGRVPNESAISCLDRNFTSTASWISHVCMYICIHRIYLIAYVIDILVMCLIQNLWITLRIRTATACSRWSVWHEIYLSAPLPMFVERMKYNWSCLHQSAYSVYSPN